MSIALPIAPMVPPSSLNGVENGKLPDHLLTTFGVGNARMEKTAARSMVAMLAEMKAGGFNPRQVGHYRTFQEQLNLFLSRYREASQSEWNATPAQHRKQWDDARKYGYTSNLWIKKLINGRYPATAATPGKSNHGLGLAIDLAEEYDTDSAPDAIRTQWVQWLVNNAHRYGFSAELQSEPWHWRYIAGDKIPSATLVFESNGGQSNVSTNNPAPGPAIILAYPGTPLRLGSKGESVKLVQAVVGAKQDGDFGLATERRVRDWQARNRLLADGVVGSVTWKKMFG